MNSLPPRQRATPRRSRSSSESSPPPCCATYAAWSTIRRPRRIWPRTHSSTHGADYPISHSAVRSRRGCSGLHTAEPSTTGVDVATSRPRKNASPTSPTPIPFPPTRCCTRLSSTRCVENWRPFRRHRAPYGGCEKPRDSRSPRSLGSCRSPSARSAGICNEVGATSRPALPRGVPTQPMTAQPMTTQPTLRNPAEGPTTQGEHVQGRRVQGNQVQGHQLPGHVR